MSLPGRPPSRWVITGVAGFIGSHLLEALLNRGATVTGLDNFSGGSRANLDAVREGVSAAAWARFQLVEGDVVDPADVARAMNGAEVVLHQAAQGSVPRSLDDPLHTHATNVTGFLQVLEAARAAGVRRVVYASSSAVYGDCTDQPAREDRIGRPLSPYGLTKLMGEQYAAVTERCFGLSTVGLRYFNVFGPRQDPAGAYAAVIPRWIDAMLGGRPVEIHGDGGTTRDFCPVELVVEANLKAATVALPPEAPRVFNVGLGRSITLNELFQRLRNALAAGPQVEPVHRPERAGDIRHSCADTTRLQRWLDVGSVKSLDDALRDTAGWFARARAGLSLS